MNSQALQTAKENVRLAQKRLIDAREWYGGGDNERDLYMTREALAALIIAVSELTEAVSQLEVHG